MVWNADTGLLLKRSQEEDLNILQVRLSDFKMGAQSIHLFNLTFQTQNL